MSHDVPSASPDEPPTPLPGAAKSGDAGRTEARAEALDRLMGLDDSPPPEVRPSRPSPEALRIEEKFQRLDAVGGPDSDAPPSPGRPAVDPERARIEAKLLALDRLTEAGQQQPPADTTAHPQCPETPAQRKAALLDGLQETDAPDLTADSATEGDRLDHESSDHTRPGGRAETRFPLPGLNNPNETGADAEAYPVQVQGETSDAADDTIVPAEDLASLDGAEVGDPPNPESGPVDVETVVPWVPEIPPLPEESPPDGPKGNGPDQDAVIPWVPEIPPEEAPPTTAAASEQGDAVVVPAQPSAPEASPKDPPDTPVTAPADQQDNAIEVPADPPSTADSQADADSQTGADSQLTTVDQLTAGDAQAADGSTDAPPAVVPLADGDWRARVFDKGIETPAGRAYFAAGDGIIVSAMKALPDPDRFTLDLHGNPSGFEVDGDWLTASDLAVLIRADEEWKGRPIRLISCETGKGDDPVAQKLADELGTSVKAPTEPASVIEKTGEVISTEWHVDENGIDRATMPPNGEWIVFRPSGKES